MTEAPFQTTVDRRAENSVEIWSASKCLISVKPRTLSYHSTHSSSRPFLDVPDHVVEGAQSRRLPEPERGEPYGGESGSEIPVVTGAVDERVFGLAVSGDGGAAHDARVVLESDAARRRQVRHVDTAELESRVDVGGGESNGP